MGPSLDRAVHKGVEVLGPPGAIRLLRQGHERKPALGQVQHQLMGAPALPLHLQHHPSQGQEAMVTAQVAGAHAQLSGQHPPVDLQGLKGGEGQAPGRHLQAPGAEALATLVNLQPLQGADVVANQIGAGRPGGKAQGQGRLAWRKAKASLHQVAMRLAQVELQQKRLAGDALRHGPG